MRLEIKRMMRKTATGSEEWVCIFDLDKKGDVIILEQDLMKAMASMAEYIERELYNTEEVYQP